MMRAPRLFLLLVATSLLCAALVLPIGCGGAVPRIRQTPPLTEHNRELYARTNLEQARALIAEGRLEHAESRARRGLGYEPDNVQLLRLRAEILEALGRSDEASAVRARAEQLQPLSTPVSAHRVASGFPVTVLLMPPLLPQREQSAGTERVPTAWPRGIEAETLVRRVSTRVPNATILLIDASQLPAETIPAAAAFLDSAAPHAALSLRVERAYCGNTVKDGRFAVAWLRVAAGAPGQSAGAAAPHLVRATLSMPVLAPGEDCREAALADALERALALGSVEELLSGTEGADPAAEGYSADTARALFPVLASRASEEVDRGRRYLVLGDLALAQEHFEQAVAIDPGDLAAVGFLDEVDRSLALAKHLDAAGRGAPIATQLSETQRSGMEAQLEYETTRREEMLAALAVLYETRNAPTPGTVANMRRVDLQDSSATGAALAMPHVPKDRALDVRTLFAPDGTVLARYFFADDGVTPLLREEDTDGDLVADRWVGYEGGLIREIWESDGDSGSLPTLHVVYSPGGQAIERIEFDHNADGEADRIFAYASGVLQDEACDTDGDGTFDRFQQFDASGSLTMREEDVDGDEEIDVRTAYTNGRIVRREILNSELLSEFQ